MNSNSKERNRKGKAIKVWFLDGQFSVAKKKLLRNCGCMLVESLASVTKEWNVSSSGQLALALVILRIRLTCLFVIWYIHPPTLEYSHQPPEVILYCNSRIRTVIKQWPTLYKQYHDAPQGSLPFLYSSIMYSFIFLIITLVPPGISFSHMHWQ